MFARKSDPGKHLRVSLLYNSTVSERKEGLSVLGQGAKGQHLSSVSVAK